MDVKELYRYTLEHKWKPMEKNYAGFITTAGHKCIFCADSVDRIEDFRMGRYHFSQNCENCRIDKSICDSIIQDNYLNTLMRKIEDTTGFERVDAVKQVIKALESHL